MYGRLVEFEREHSHCNVPAIYERDPQLGTWTNNCIAPGSLDTSLSHAAGLSDIAVCHA